jgi:hypothetical protein
MTWTVRFFRHRAEGWQSRELHSVNPGHRAVAARQQAMWDRFASTAEQSFAKTKAKSKIDLNEDAEWITRFF